MRRFDAIALAAALIACAVLSGCSLALAAPVVIEGQSFPSERASALQAGMTTEDVELLLGPPLRRARVDGRQLWTYDFKRARRQCRMILFDLIPLEPRRTDWQHLDVVFDGGGVVRAVQRRSTSEGRSQNVIVGRRTP